MYFARSPSRTSLACEERLDVSAKISAIALFLKTRP
jgi:hypothetical protein